MDRTLLLNPFSSFTASGWHPPALCCGPLLLAYLMRLPMALRTVAVLFQVAQEAQSSGRTPAPRTASPAPRPPRWLSLLLGAATSRDLAFSSISVPMNCLLCQSLLGQTEYRWPDSCSLMQLPELRHHLFSEFLVCPSSLHSCLPARVPASQSSLQLALYQRLALNV